MTLRRHWGIAGLARQETKYTKKVVTKQEKQNILAQHKKKESAILPLHHKTGVVNYGL